MKKILFLALILLACSASFAEPKLLPYNDFQMGFMKTVSEYAQKYRKAENELQKSALVTERFQQFEKLKGDPRKIKDWIGILQVMGTTSDGRAYIVVSLSPNLLTFGTWNNSFSDQGYHSLIPQNSPLFAKLAVMKTGNIVRFSGGLRRAKNPTEEGKMTSPDFLFIFSSIDKIGEKL